MCSRGYVWQSQRRDSYQKGVPSWGGKRGAGPLTHLSGKLLVWLLLPKWVPIFIRLKIFWRGGTKSAIKCPLALGMESCVLTSRTWQFDTPMEQASCYVLRGAKCLSNIWLCGLHHLPESTWFAMMGYPLFLLSDKISTSQLLPLLTPWLLVPESEHVVDKSSKAIDHTAH